MTLHRLLAHDLQRRQQLCAGQAAKHSRDRRIDGRRGQRASRQFARKEMDADERRDADQNPEAGNFELANAEDDRIHGDG
jgi:hypothetical protein